MRRLDAQGDDASALGMAIAPLTVESGPPRALRMRFFLCGTLTAPFSKAIHRHRSRFAGRPKEFLRRQGERH
jgi:hypothetical protein